MPEFTRPATWEDVKSLATQVTIDDVAVNVLDLEGLLITKQGVRLKDQADAQAIRRAMDLLKRTK